MSKQTIGEFLATQRKIKGYTQQQIADKLGVSNRTLSSWEQGRTYPDILILPMLAEIYGVSVDEILLRGHDAEPSATEEDKPKNSSYIDARNAHTAHTVWLSGVCFAAPVFTAMTFISAYFEAAWAIAVCAVLAGLTLIAAITAIIFFHRSALNHVGTYLPNKEKGGISDKCSLAISLNTCRTLAVLGFAFLLPIAVWIILFCIDYSPSWGFYLGSRRVNPPAYSMLFPLIVGIGALVASVIYKNIAVKKYGDGRQNTLQRRNRMLFFICMTAILPVVASVICVSEIGIYRYQTEVYSAPREEFLRKVQTVYIAEPMASLYGVEEGDVFLDIQAAHVGYKDYRNEDGYYHITGNLYCGEVVSGATGTYLTIYYLAEDGNYEFVAKPKCVWGPGEIFEEHFDFEGNSTGQYATIGVDLVFLNEEILPDTFALDKELIVGTPSYDSPPFFRVKPFQPVVWEQHTAVGEVDGVEVLMYYIRCDYFPLVMPIACIVSAVSIAVGCTVYYLKRKRIY